MGISRVGLRKFCEKFLEALSLLNQPTAQLPG